ncbi:hypothetical protein [Kordiimonas aquimaris]|uniref:hypothetical protein n=1 Tax=Kordiimonas aquimaris TaxID=707591 RepID=UPI0021D0B68B|nr:hypothetical protein [Kordiimonas aquimaris]
MRKVLIFVVSVTVLLGWLDYRMPTTPSAVIEVTVVSVNDAPKGNGWRYIAVAFPDGSERTIETLVPFFYRSGYAAYVAAYERILFPDLYDFISPPD